MSSEKINTVNCFGKLNNKVPLHICIYYMSTSMLPSCSILQVIIFDWRSGHIYFRFDDSHTYARNNYNNNNNHDKMIIWQVQYCTYFILPYYQECTYLPVAIMALEKNRKKNIFSWTKKPFFYLPFEISCNPNSQGCENLLLYSGISEENNEEVEKESSIISQRIHKAQHLA